MTVKELLDYIYVYLGDREELFEVLYDHLSKELGLDITPIELEGLLTRQGWLPSQIKNSPLMVYIKRDVARIPLSQNRHQYDLLDKMNQGNVKMHPDQNHNKRKK